MGAGHYYEMKLGCKKVGFVCIGRFPHPQAKDIMVINRIVIVPEFQGFGLGIKFLNIVANLYRSDRVRITTSLKPFILALKKNKNWKCKRFGRVSNPGKSSLIHNKDSHSVSVNRITGTFQYSSK